MRLTCFLLAFLLFSTVSPAQPGFGIEGGIGMSSMKFAPPTDPILYTRASTGAIISGKFGGLIDLPMQKHIYFQSGVFVSLRGGVRDFSYHENDSFNESIHQTLYILYADLPVSVVYKTGGQGKGRFIFGAGATFSYLITGENKLVDNQVYAGVTANTSDKARISPGNTVHAFDLGLNLTTGYELPAGLFFRAYYTMGVNDIGIGTEIDKNRIWGIAAGYFFGKARDINKEGDDLIDKTPD